MIDYKDFKDFKKDSSQPKITEDLFDDYAQDYFNRILEGRPLEYFLRALFDAAVLPVYRRGSGLIDSVLPLRGMCYPSHRKLFVNTKGQFYMCEKMGGKVDLGNISGGLEPKKIVQAFNAYSNTRSNLCRNCWASRICDSCASASLDLHGISIEGQKMTCGNYKRKLVDGLRILSSLLRSDTLGKHSTFRIIISGGRMSETQYDKKTEPYKVAEKLPLGDLESEINKYESYLNTNRSYGQRIRDYFSSERNNIL